MKSIFNSIINFFNRIFKTKEEKVEELGFISYSIYFGGCSKYYFSSVTLGYSVDI